MFDPPWWFWQLFLAFPLGIGLCAWLTIRSFNKPKDALSNRHNLGDVE